MADAEAPAGTEGQEVDETSEVEGVESIEMGRAQPEVVGNVPLPRRQLSEHFDLREFHCKDGTAVPENTVDGLVALCRDVLEPLRAVFGACTVNSGFRSKAHNDAVGGASSSYHRYDLHVGHAASDVVFKNGNPVEWHRKAHEILGAKGGVGKYQTFVHVDNRAGRWRSPEIGDTAPPTTGSFPGELSRAKRSRGDNVCKVQERLRQLGHSIDRLSSCPFGPQTEAAVKAFQGSKGLPASGVVDRPTWNALFGG